MNNKSQALATDVYTIDPVHSSVAFGVKHMMISHVIGHFTKFEGTIAFDPNDLPDSQISATINVPSIDTHSKERDEHLKKADFFDTEKFPTITFFSKSITGQKGEYRIAGNLTVKGRPKAVSFPVTINGPVKDMNGHSVIGLIGQFTINRQDHDISFNKTIDNGVPMVDNDIRVEFNIEAKK